MDLRKGCVLSRSYLELQLGYFAWGGRTPFPRPPHGLDFELCLEAFTSIAKYLYSIPASTAIILQHLMDYDRASSSLSFVMHYSLSAQVVVDLNLTHSEPSVFARCLEPGGMRIEYFQNFCSLRSSNDPGLPLIVVDNANTVSSWDCRRPRGNHRRKSRSPSTCPSWLGWSNPLWEYYIAVLYRFQIQCGLFLVSITSWTVCTAGKMWVYR